MALKLHQGEITDSEGNVIQYAFKTMGSRKGIPTKLKLAKLIGPSVTGAFSSVTTDENGEAVIKPEDLNSITATILEAISDDESALDLIETLLSGVMMDGVEVDFDEYWAGNYGTMYKMALIVAKANFGSLLSLVGISPMHSQIPKDLGELTTQ